MHPPTPPQGAEEEDIMFHATIHPSIAIGVVLDPQSNVTSKKVRIKDKVKVIPNSLREMAILRAMQDRLRTGVKSITHAAPSQTSVASNRNF